MHLVIGAGSSPSPGRPTPEAVKQDKSSGGCVDTIKTRPDPQRVPIGNAQGKQPNTEALCQTPPCALREWHRGMGWSTVVGGGGGMPPWICWSRLQPAAPIG